jgi:RNA polymerase sigma-70 factor (ECF subfamily)
MNEKSLLRRLRRGDESVLPELIRRYSGYAYAIASNILSHVLCEEDIEEVVSDSFLSIWENRRNIETEMLKAYLAAVVRNKAKTALRKHREEEPLDDDLLEISVPNQPEQRILLSELRELAHAAVDTLGEPDREIFQRYYFLYQKTEDISKALGLKDATVRAKLARGRKKLKDYLTERGFRCEDTHY